MPAAAPGVAGRAAADKWPGVAGRAAVVPPRLPPPRPLLAATRRSARLTSPPPHPLFSGFVVFRKPAADGGRAPPEVPDLRAGARPASGILPRGWPSIASSVVNLAASRISPILAEAEAL
eukprot:scaffold46851_cov33-Tisochrysis_lutea.AAC.3